MVSAAKAASAVEQLARLVAKAEGAKALTATRRAELAGRRGELNSLAERRRQYQRDVGGGAKPDPRFEAECEALSGSGVREAEGSVPPTLTDQLAEDRLQGAEMAQAEAERALSDFCAGRLGALTRELMHGVEAEKAEALAAARELPRRLAPIRARWRRVYEVHARAGRSVDAPAEPYSAIARGLAEMERG